MDKTRQALPVLGDFDGSSPAKCWVSPCDYCNTDPLPLSILVVFVPFPQIYCIVDQIVRNV